MKKLSEIVGLVLVAALLAATGCATAPAPKPATTTDPSSDMAALQGAWRGKETGADTRVPCYMIISGDNLEFRGSTGDEWYKGTFFLVENADPRRMDMTVTDCVEPKYIGRLARAIYRIEGDTVTISGFGLGKLTVPAKFDSPGAHKVVFKKT